MLQKMYEFLLYRSIDNIKMYNFLVRAFPKQEKAFINRVEKEIAKVYIPEDEIERIKTEVWEKICSQIKEKRKEGII